MTWAGVIAGAYLVGAIPFSYLVVRLLVGRDVRGVGSGNAGATNAMRAAGTVAGLSVLALDVLKGALPLVVTQALTAPPVVVAAAAVAAVLGHCFPVYIGFRGGKGVATALGAAAALELLPTLIATAVLLAVVLWKRYVSLGSIVAVSLLPLLMMLPAIDGEASPSHPWSVAAAAAIAVLVVVRHRGNLKRLLAGDERRLGEGMEISR